MSCSTLMLYTRMNLRSSCSLVQEMQQFMINFDVIFSGAKLLKILVFPSFLSAGFSMELTVIMLEWSETFDDIALLIYYVYSFMLKDLNWKFRLSPSISVWNNLEILLAIATFASRWNCLNFPLGFWAQCLLMLLLIADWSFGFSLHMSSPSSL
jgi:hypothetical protein